MQPRAHNIASLEWPTLLLIAGAYGGWLAITLAYRHWPLALVAPATALLITLHSSLQHEVIHGHPTRLEGLNRALIILSLTLWLPFDRYKQLHLQHHVDARITDPIDDPESFYWQAQDWQRLGPLTRASLRIQQTLAGRVIVGSFWGIGAFLASEFGAVVRNKPQVRRAWVGHLASCVPAILWLKLVCGMPLWLYLLAMVIPANGLLLIRSFAEHRARRVLRQRTAIVEGSWILGPLFLFNNLHALHHETPMLPWYRYNRQYRLTRERLLAENGGLVYRSYFEVARRFLFRSHDSPVHPTGRAPISPADISD